jgi:hypothetical protein
MLNADFSGFTKLEIVGKKIHKEVGQITLLFYYVIRLIRKHLIKYGNVLKLQDLENLVYT